MSKQSDLVSVSQGSGGAPLYIDTTNDRVGIGTTTPAAAIEVIAGSDNNSNNGLVIKNPTGGTRFAAYTEENVGVHLQANEGGAARAFMFDVGASEAMRIDSSGNLLVGKTSSNGQVQGCELRDHGQGAFTNDGGNALQVRRLSSDGDIIQIVKDVTEVGSIGANGGGVYLEGSAGGFRVHVGGAKIFPSYNSGAARDNVIDWGASDARWDDIYATNGTIQTSDRNEKQDIEVLSDAEQRVAVAAKGLLRKYRWIDAVAEKGDAARIHFGIIAQDLQAAFEAEGLDAGRYGMFISSTWWEAEVERTREVEQEDGTTVTETYTATETYDEPTEGATERTRLGVRYPELLAFIIAAL